MRTGGALKKGKRKPHAPRRRRDSGAAPACEPGAAAGSVPGRRWEIIGAAFEVLTEKGYRGTSMLEIARRANASKETLYAWFGSKEGLFAEMIRSNASQVYDDVGAALAAPGRPLREALTTFGAKLLTLLTRPQVMAVQRAAIAEAESSPELARILWENGRERIVPALAAYLESERRAGRLAYPDVAEACSLFLSLVVRNTQHAMLLGMQARPTDAEIAGRAERAAELFLALFAPPGRPTRSA